MMEVEEDKGELSRRRLPHLIQEHECCSTPVLAEPLVPNALMGWPAEAFLVWKEPAGRTLS